MNLSREAKIMSGLTLIAIPTIMYGGLVLVGVLTHGRAGFPTTDLVLDGTQWALWRAGHAHAGVWVVLSLVIQILVDATRLPKRLAWTARLTAPLAAIVVSGGFFGLAYASGFRWMLYAGALLLFISLLVTAIGLFRAR